MKTLHTALHLPCRVAFIACAVFFLWSLQSACLAASVRTSVFPGTNSESWESYQFGQLPDAPLPFLGGLGTIYEASPSHDMLIYQETYSFGTGPVSFGLGPFPARAADGNHGFGNSLGSGIQGVITLTKAATAFGGYWASASVITPIAFQFLDADGGLVGNDSFIYSRPNNNGTLEWIGWEFSSPVRQILYGGTFIVNDSLRFNLVPEPSACILACACILPLLLKRTRSMR